MKRTLLDQTDKTTTSSQMTSLSNRITTIENGNLLNRMTNAESAITSQSGRLTALETWRSNKAPAKADVATNYSVPTAVITLGLNAPTAAGINAIVNTIMAEVNGIYAILRSREIMAT